MEALEQQNRHGLLLLLISKLLGGQEMKSSRTDLEGWWVWWGLGAAVMDQRLESGQEWHFQNAQSACQCQLTHSDASPLMNVHSLSTRSQKNMGILCVNSLYCKRCKSPLLFFEFQR